MRLIKVLIRNKAHIVAIALYALAAVIFTYPLLWRLSDSLAGVGAGDPFLYVWNIETFWHQILSGHNPFFTDRMFFPYGTSLVFHTYAPLVSLLGGLFFHNWVVFLNLMVLFSFIGASYAMFILVNHLTRRAALAIISGLLYGMSPIMTSFIVSGHYYFAFAALFLPLGLLLAACYLEKLQARYLIYYAVCFWLCFFTDYYTTILLIGSTGLFALTIAVKQVTASNLYIIIRHITLVVVFAIVLPLLLFLAFMQRSHLITFPASQKTNVTAICNTNLVGFFVPNKADGHFQTMEEYTATFLGLPTTEKNTDTPSYSLGVLLAIFGIAGFGLWATSRYARAAGVVAIGFFLLSLGTVIRAGSTAVLWSWLTPYYWFAKLPFMQFIDCPLRFPIAVQLGFVLLIALLAAELAKSRLFTTRALVILLAVLFIIEYGRTNLPLAPASFPQVYQLISQRDDTRSVLELPSGIAESKRAFGYDWSLPALQTMQLYWQTLHHKPRLAGYMSRIPDSTYRRYMHEPVLGDIFTMTSWRGTWPETTYSKEEVSAFLKKFQIGYIVLSPNPRKEYFAHVVEALLRDFPYQKFDDQGYTLYQLNQ